MECVGVGSWERMVCRDQIMSQHCMRKRWLEQLYLQAHASWILKVIISAERTRTRLRVPRLRAVVVVGYRDMLSTPAEPT